MYTYIPSRLSRPLLSIQLPLPKQDVKDELRINPLAAANHESPDHDTDFILSPLLTLPPAFGVTHVGETFSCTLCANNELPTHNNATNITGVRITAEMQTPSQPSGIPLELIAATTEKVEISLEPGATHQRIVRFDLKEDGNHILAVTVTYTETQMAGEGQAAGGRVRTFRKLYQFVARQLLSVRTKVQLMPARGVESPARYALEAQLENLADDAVVLEAVTLVPKAGFISKSLNPWDIVFTKKDITSKPVLNPGDVMQATFRVSQETASADVSSRGSSQTRDGRVVLGQLSIQWRGSMGELGSLSTGWLSGKKR